MRVTYDATTDVAYIELRELGPGEVLGPTLLLVLDEALGRLLLADVVEADGMLAGLEVVGASSCLPPKVLAAAECIDGANLRKRVRQRLGAREAWTGRIH